MFLFNILMTFAGIWLFAKLIGVAMAWVRELIERMKPGNFSETKKWCWIDRHHDTSDEDEVSDFEFDEEHWYKGL